MLKKLIKYDFIWINKFMMIYFSISLIVCVLTRIMSYFTDSFFCNLIYLILRGVAISCFVSILINCVIRVWARFSLQTYKDESYLTHTLPVSKKTLFNSKIISSIISLILSIVVILVCFLIVYLDKDFIEYIKDFIEADNALFIVLSLILTVILETTYALNCGIIGMLIGHKSNSKRMLKSIIVGIALYFIIQSILLGVVYSVGLLNSQVNELFTNASDANFISSVKSLVIIANCIYLVFISGMYFVGKKLFNDGVNVD